MTKANEARRSVYENSNLRSVFEAYEKPSYQKQRAERWCRQDMEKLKGFDFRIGSYNTFTFTCGFQYLDPETGALRLRYHTAQNVYDFEL